MVNITTQNENNGRERQAPSLIETFFNDSFFQPFMSPGIIGARALDGVHTAFPKVDVTENEQAITVTANVPGMDPDDITVEVGEDYLTLSGTMEKEHTDKDTDGKIYRYERECGEFHRQFTLPARVDAEHIEAKARDGVLTITLPKTETATKRTVKVERES